LGCSAGIRAQAFGSASQPALRQRRVWLRLLLNQVEQDVRGGKGMSEQQRYLAGLTRVRHLYVVEDQQDLILEGPAEDHWEVQQGGMVLGATSGHPVLQLDDLAVAWRNATQNAPPPSVSLEHRQESVRRIQEIIRSAAQLGTPAARDEFTRRLEQAWGVQDAVTGGVPPDTRFNKVMVDADWEMKRISLGRSDPGIADFPTYVDLEFDDLRGRVEAEGVRARKPPGGSRFWFFPAYADFARTEKFDAVAIPDDPVELLTESHFRNLAQGKQIAQEPTAAARQFVAAFTEHYQAIAQANPLYAELRNLFDWVAIVRLIRLIDVPRRLGWDSRFLVQGYPIAPVQVFRTMPGVVAVRHAQVPTEQGMANVVLPAWGGVSMDMEPCLRHARFPLERSLGLRWQAAAADRPGGSRWFSTLES
jgi:hypothetical protein